ncbi:HD domain-containing phosphohydrolase [Xanthobacter sediminis]
MSGTEGPSDRHPLRRLSIRLPLLIGIVVVLSMFIMDAVLMWQGWKVAHSALLSSARENSLTMGRLVDERAHNLLSSATATLHQLAQDPITAAGDLPDRLSRAEILANTLKNIPILAAVYVGYANGEFLLLRPLRGPDVDKDFDPPAGAAFLLQSVTLDGQGQQVGEWRFYDAQMRILNTRPMPGYKFDPRTRPWYKDAMGQEGIRLTAPYIFFTTRKVGVTISEKPKYEQAVVAIDVELSELNAQLSGLRPTPRTEIAIASADRTVVAYTDPEQVVVRQNGALHFQRLLDLGQPALVGLAAHAAAPREALAFDIGGETWFGIKIPLAAVQGSDLSLYIATPDSDLLQATREGLAQQAVAAGGFTIALMLFGWVAGKRLGRDLTDLTARAQQLSRFDFSRPLRHHSLIREVQELERVLDEVCVTIENFLVTTETIGREKHLDRMLGTVLHRIVATTGCTFGAVYLLDEAGDRLQLTAVAQGGATTARLGGTPAPVIPDPELPLSAAARREGPIDGIDPKIAQLAVPLTDRQHRPIGLLILGHPFDVGHGGRDFRIFVEKLSSALSAAVEVRRMADAQRRLLDGFIRLVASAVDAKSPYTGGHCLRVPELATMIIERMAREHSGPYGAYAPSADELYAFHLGAWLHDCGKVTSPEHVIDKATKLETIHNRIHEVRTRFEVLWRDAEIAHLERLRAGEDAGPSQARREAEQKQLRDDFAFIAQCNIGGEFMTDAAVARLTAIAGRTWTRHFSDRLGLSREEEGRLAPRPEAPLPTVEPLLSDRPEHKLGWGARRPPVEKNDPANIYGFDMKLPAVAFDRGEIHNLSIRRGTLTDEERFKINDHIVQTYIMLRSLPWPEPLRLVPEIAATHHERMDGKGYPRRLAADRLTLEDRVMALADVFEALTAADRPYKPAKTLSEALRIMMFMCREGHLDPEIFRYFLESGLWNDYAARFLRDDQRDAVDIPGLIGQLPSTPPSQQPPHHHAEPLPKSA